MSDDVYKKREKAQSKIDAMKKEVAVLDKEIKRLSDIKIARAKKKAEHFKNSLFTILGELRNITGDCGDYDYWDDSDQLVGRLVKRLCDTGYPDVGATELPYDFEDIIKQSIVEVDEDINNATNMKKVLVDFIDELKRTEKVKKS